MSKDADAIVKALRAIPVQIKRDIQPAIDAGAQEIMMRARYLAPKDDGALQKSIRIEAGPRELSATVSAGGDLTTRPVRDGISAEYDYALGMEYGTAETPAQPFWWAAVNSLNKRVKRRIDRAIGKSIRTAWGKK